MAASGPPLPPFSDDDTWAAFIDDIDADHSNWESATSERFDPYSILNISRSSSSSAIRSRYRHMSLLFHPDRGTASSSSLPSIFPVVSAASSTLSEPSSRAEFDMLGPNGSNGTRFDSFSESLLSCAELQKHIIENACSSELQRRERLANTQLDGTIGPESIPAELSSEVQFDLGTGIDVVGIAAWLTSLQIFWTRTYNSLTSTKFSLKMSSSLILVDLVGSHKLSKAASGSMGVGLQSRWRGMLTLWFRLVHAFTETITGTVTLSLAPQPMLNMSLAKRRDRRTGVISSSCGMRLSGIHSGVEAKIKYRLSRRHFMFVGLEAFLTRTSVEVGVGRRFLNGLGLSYSAMISDTGGFVVNLTATKGLCCLRLPLPIASGYDVDGQHWWMLMALPFVGAAMVALAGSQREYSALGLEYLRLRTRALRWQSQHRRLADSITMQEEDRNGLVIVEAKYGDLSNKNDDDDDPVEELFPSVMDATISLQVAVCDGRLEVLGPIGKLPGLFPIRQGAICHLQVRYRFDYVDHMCVVGDDEDLYLPDRRHIVP